MSDDNFTAPMSSGGGGGALVAGVGTDYRRLQSPIQIDTNLPDSGAASRAEALANTFKEFAGTASAVGNKLNTLAGSQAGAAAGQDPNFAPKTGLAAITAYG